MIIDQIQQVLTKLSNFSLTLPFLEYIKTKKKLLTENVFRTQLTRFFINAIKEMEHFLLTEQNTRILSLTQLN